MALPNLGLKETADGSWANFPEAFQHAYGPPIQTNDYANPSEPPVALRPTNGVTGRTEGPAEVYQEGNGFEENVMIYYRAALASSSTGSFNINGQEVETSWPGNHMHTPFTIATARPIDGEDLVSEVKNRESQEGFAASSHLGPGRTIYTR